MKLFTETALMQTSLTIYNLCVFRFVDIPAGYYSDDEYVSGEDDNKDEAVSLPTPKFRGIQPPPNSQHVTQPPLTKDVSKSFLTSSREWTHSTCAQRAAGTDPVNLRKEITSANENMNLGSTGCNTGRASSTRSHTDWASSAVDRHGSDDGTPFGVPPKVRMKTQSDTANWDWVEKVLKITNGESPSQGSRKVSEELILVLSCTSCQWFRRQIHVDIVKL